MTFFLSPCEKVEDHGPAAQGDFVCVMDTSSIESPNSLWLARSMSGRIVIDQLWRSLTPKKAIFRKAANIIVRANLDTERKQKVKPGMALEMTKAGMCEHKYFGSFAYSIHSSRCQKPKIIPLHSIRKRSEVKSGQ